MILDRFTAILKTAGFDLVRPFSLEWLGQAAIALPPADFGRRNAMGVVIGNTRALWPCFVEALRNEDSLRHAEHPLDAYVMRSIRDAARQIPVETKILWAHDMEPEPIPVQRMAEVAGLAKVSPSHLSIHPRFGPWIALRAVLVLDAEGPAGPAPSVPDHCSPCERPCMSALRRALEASNTNERDVQRDATVIRGAWRAWLEVRAVCPIGAEHRYGQAQAEYHYAKRLPLISRG
jgi:cyanocobalamin reductase (cyanide-eliminating) / alkylcobalamin dealkylase